MAPEQVILEDIQESELTPENGEVYLFQYLSSLEKNLANVSLDILKTKQGDIEQTLIKVVTALSPYPLPGRALRNLVGRCLVTLYTRGETRSLFDTLQVFMKIVSDYKNQDKELKRIAAFSCVGDLMGVFGSQFMSFMAEIVIITMKTVKSSQSPLLRYTALNTLHKALITAKRAVTDSANKDIMKQTRSLLTDKSLPVQRAAAQVLIAMFPSDSPPTHADVESILAQCIRSLDSSDQLTRTAHAQLVGHLLASTQAERQISIPSTSTSTGPKQKGPSGGSNKRDKDKDGNLIGEDEGTLTPGTPAHQGVPVEATRPLLPPSEMLSHLSMYFNKSNTSRKTKIGLFDFYVAVLTKLGADWVEVNYALLVTHFMSEIVSHHGSLSGQGFSSVAGGSTKRYEKLLACKLVSIILRDVVGVRMLSEQGQIQAIRELSMAYLKRWPAMLGSSAGAPGSVVLNVALKEVAGLIGQLGNLPGTIQDTLGEPLITLLSHPSHSVRISAAWALRCFCASTPLRLPKAVLNVVELLQRDLNLLSSPSTSHHQASTLPPPPSRALGHAHALAALVSLIPSRPLYMSYDISAKVLDLAVQLLKRAGEHSLETAWVEVEVAWTAISALLCLGPGFVRPQLAQLLVLWRNALPKPTGRDLAGGSGLGSGAGSNSSFGNPVSANNRSPIEWAFLLHVRECALGAVLCFLRHNASVLVTLDVARRISSVLGNALQFANNFQGLNIEDPLELSTLNSSTASSAAGSGSSTSAVLESGYPSGHSLTLRAREALLRRRVFQCFSALGVNRIADATQTALLQSTVVLFGSMEGYAGSQVQAAIASSSGSFSNLWASADGYAYGAVAGGKPGEVVEGGFGIVDGINLDGVGVLANDTEESSEEGEDILNRDTVEVAINSLLRKPVLGACEHDSLVLYQQQSKTTDGRLYHLIEPPPPTTAVVDAAVELFAQLLPMQDVTTTTKTISTLLESVRSQKLDRNVGRKAAVFVNAVVALVLALRNAMGSSHAKQAKDALGNAQVTTLLSPFFMDALIDGDPVLRMASSEAIGRLASLSNTSFLTTEIKDLVDQVVSNRDPYGRAGCALAFGAIYSYVGGLAAGPLLKTTVNVLMSLSNDPHPVVHFWALRSLATVINAASLAYAPFVSSTLGMLLKIYMLDSHEREGGTVSNANLSGDCPAYPVVCQIIDAVTTVLGPDMHESPRTRNLVLNMIKEFSLEDDEGARVEAIKCIQHFLMFAPEYVDIPALVKQFRLYLGSSRRPPKLASINALYQLVQKDALAMSKLGGDRLVEDLFAMLDDDASVQGVRNVISSWLQQTVIHNPSAWIDLCQRIMARSNASQQVTEAASNQNLRDDEGESLNSRSGNAAGSMKNPDGIVHLTSRWRTQLFALQCLHSICSIVADSGRKEHIDPVYARNIGLPVSSLLVSRVPDLIKMAFTASTAYVTEIRLEGLVVLKDVIKVFATTPDPAYDDALLLEQHQAPITAALTPAFSSDSTPEILASAVDACAAFVGCGVVKDVNRMGRILKLLTTALEQSKVSGMVSLGEAGEMSPNASAMLRITTLSAWAQLQVASAQQAYLQDVIKPYSASLAPLWIAALRDYASIRVDSDFTQESSNAAIDTSYSSLGREVLLPYYADAWSVILSAVAYAMETSDPFILAAMDGQESKRNGVILETNRRREEPTVFFYIVFGLVFEALTTSSSESSSSSLHQSVLISALRALKSLVRPEYAGNALTESTIFEELMSQCYRLALTEFASVQSYLLEMFASLATTHRSSFVDPASPNSPATHCLRISAHTIKHSSSFSKGPVIPGDIQDRIKMLNTAFTAVIKVMSILRASQREDVRGVAIMLYIDLLKDESSDIDLVGPTLPSLKALLEFPTTSQEDRAMYVRVVHGLLSACLLNVDEMRGRQGVISTKKVKNNMLAAVLILTVIPSWASIGRPVIEYCCFQISQKLLEADDPVALTAAHCSKTLIVASSGGSSVLRECTRQLLPGLIEFIAGMVPSVNDGTISEAHIAAIGEVHKAFASFFSSVPGDQRIRALAILLPTLSLLLSGTHSASEPVRTQTVVQLLSYATAAPAAFKDATRKLDQSIQELLELSIRRAVGGTVTGNSATTKPQISLRSF
ncbi:hypothetical protein AMATHDRAFT_55203 [Amanita thiersii Skay4041]|uniref:LAA1-like C-terminal TPR repeats domain-containing protein n=1 Tax=Amanita thiersii Skay4041 TaxID=703135 RepID=A0A2A9NZ49_9AGAR|nr:hypothetical protein AMATHDRAFT_55203 [Amanita thiersii Skay4041]